MIVFLADLHLHLWKDCSMNGGFDRLDDGLSVLRQSLELAQASNATWVFGGDLKWHRTLWHQQALNGAMAIIAKYKSVPKIMLSGQHDGVGNKNTGLRPFSRDAQIIEEPDILTIGGETCAVWPWAPTHDRLNAFIDTARKMKARVLFAHAMLKGSAIGQSGYTSKALPLEAFGMVGRQRVFEQAFFGDNHKQQSVTPNVHYVGSPLGLKWDETDPGKGCITYCLDTRSVKRVRMEAPQYIIIRQEHKDAVCRIKAGRLNGHFVRVVGGPWLTQSFVDEWLIARHSGIRFLQVIARPQATSSGLARGGKIHAGLTDEKLFKLYMDEDPPDEDLPRAAVLNTMLRMASEAVAPSEEVRS